ncbi:major histocompatibility complex class I-related gene protein-like isoform X2 [Gadus chalcogrammus]|uniref:major histocompatibility complex class I-related gene protein-like isoform X2 n=1 Tax=Gadus chalcogrammus TaxID=1042646 RepID=UPI0024C4C7AD|nr:major histocompatibility complex class I-related gene protein-like isoform X2 [Gadus chalcogrammus]
MKALTGLLLLVFGHGVSSVLHSMQYFLTGSSGLTTFPEFVAVGMVDGVQFDYYDSNTQRVVLKQDWMEQVTREDPDYMERNTGKAQGAQQTFKANIGIAKQRFNQTGGAHMFQFMCGCEWDDEDDSTDGYHQFGYDGEDFIAFDLKTLTWVAPVRQAVTTKLRWDQDRALNQHRKNYLTKECVDWLKRYLAYGKSTLQRTERPRVCLLQRSPSSPVVCHATGFYPDRVVVFWRRDGQELHEQVDPGEVLPNHDGTFQVSVDLNLTAVPQEDWGRYECVVQLKGIEDISTPLDPALIRTNWGRVTRSQFTRCGSKTTFVWDNVGQCGIPMHRAAPPRRSTVDVVSLQRQLLEEVKMLRRTQEQLLQVEREKLLVEREKLRLAQDKSD